jgi:anti-sigma B factor antagonist
MRIESRKKGTIVILDMAGKMVIGVGDILLRQEMKKHLEAGERSFVFNMLEVPFLDSCSIGEVVACHKRVRDKDGVIKLVLNERLHNLFTMYELMRVFPIFEDLEGALASFAA